MLKLHLICGDYYHATGPYENALRKALEGLEHRLSVERFPDAFDASVLDDLDLLVLCKEGVAIEGHLSGSFERKWISVEGEEAIGRWTMNGGTLMGWHSGVAGYREDGPITQLFGGLFLGHPPLHAFEARVTDGSHPLAAGLQSYTAYDELYRFDLFGESRDRRVFMEGVSTQSPTQPLAWTSRAGRGQVVCWLLGHCMPSMGHETARTLMRNVVVL